MEDARARKVWTLHDSNAPWSRKLIRLEGSSDSKAQNGRPQTLMVHPQTLKWAIRNKLASPFIEKFLISTLNELITFVSLKKKW
mgnify:CR=1 FL=1